MNIYLKLASYGLVAGLSFGVGWKVRDADYQAHLKQDAQAETHASETARADEHKAEALSQATRDDLATKQVQRDAVYRTIEKEIPSYVPGRPTSSDQGGHRDGDPAVPGPPADDLPTGLVWLHNQAARAQATPLPTGIDPGTPSGVGMPALAGTLVRNYALCRSWRDEVAGWRGWYDNLVTAWNADALADEARAPIVEEAGHGPQ